MREQKLQEASDQEIKNKEESGGVWGQNKSPQDPDVTLEVQQPEAPIVPPPRAPSPVVVRAVEEPKEVPVPEVIEAPPAQESGPSEPVKSAYVPPALRGKMASAAAVVASSAPVNTSMNTSLTTASGAPLEAVRLSSLRGPSNTQSTGSVSSSGAYVPPGARVRPVGGPAPVLANQEEFPTLGSVMVSQPTSSPVSESNQSASQQINHSYSNAPNLSLGNKFSALSQN